MIRKHLAAVALLMAANTANAQDINPILDPTLMVGHAGLVAADQQIRQDLGRQFSNRSARPRADATISLARFDFRPNDAVRQKVDGRAVAQMQKASGPDAAKFRAMLQSGQVRQLANSYLGRYGMSSNNLADTTALYLASAWLASRADAGDPTPAQMRGLRAQVASAMAATPGMARASDAIKQEIAEANIIQALFAGNLASAAARDPKFAPTARNAVTKGVMATYKINLAQVQLTSQGLR